MADNVGPDGMLYSAASDLCLHCLFMFFSICILRIHMVVHLLSTQNCGNLKYVKHNGLH